MNFFILFFGLINIFLTFCQVDEDDVRRSHEQYAQLMKHDGVKRVKVADAKNVQKIIKKNTMVLIFFWIDNKKETEKINEREMQILEVVAQVLQERHIAVCTCEVSANQRFAMAAGVRYTGMIKIMRGNKITTYSGQRAADVIIPFLSKMLDPPIKVLQTKSEKKLFEQNDLPKVISYLSKNSKELKVFEEVALAFQPMTTFYVVHDAKLAKFFHLKKLNSLQYVKPYEKLVAYPTKKAFTEKAIVNFINENKRQRLKKMRLENLHDIWAIDLQGVLVPTFANVKTDEGSKMLSQAKSLSKLFEKNTNLSFVWIDPTPFPGMIEYWKKGFLIDPLKPTLGIVDIHKQISAWFVPPENTGSSDFNLADMKNWLNKYIAGKLVLNPINSLDDDESTGINNSPNDENKESGSREEL